MLSRLGSGTNLGYCTNVHAAENTADIIESLKVCARGVRGQVMGGENGFLSVGIWSPYFEPPAEAFQSAQALNDWDICGVGAGHEKALNEFLWENKLYVQSLNAFPFAGFHDRVVKKKVYEPDWSTEIRFVQTGAAVGLLFDLMHTEFVPVAGGGGSISTLPIGWSDPRTNGERTESAAKSLKMMVKVLDTVSQLGKGDFTLDLEPEPGCILDTASDVIAFFDKHLPDEIHRKHIGICHDVCHAAVMFEDQREVIRRYAEAGIRVNKVQISSALDVDVRTIGVDAAIEHLTQFAEPRYLHQTGFMTDGQFELIEDLPEAIERLEAGPSAGPIPDRLRVHFHVPVYLDHIGPLGTTNDQIAEAVAAAREYHDTKHFEVETYAWGVLPEELKRDTLAEGIADELKWVLKTCGQSDS